MSRITPAQRHFAKVMATRTAAESSPGQAPIGTAYELMLAKLTDDRIRLKQIQSIERKVEAKRAMLPDYQAWIDGVLESGKGAQDDVLMTVLVWLIDVGDYAQALRISAYALKHSLVLPDQYNRNVQTMLLDEIPGAFLSKLEDPDAALLILNEVQELTHNLDAPDQARAKLHKAAGYALLGKIGEGDISEENMQLAELANMNLHRALELHSGIGVKKDIEKLERRLKKPDPS